MANVSIKLDTRRKDSKNRYPIRFFISHKSVTTSINSNYKVPSDYWDPMKFIKNGAPEILDVPTANYKLRNKLAEINDFLIDIENSGIAEGLTSKEIKSLYFSNIKKETTTFHQYFEEFIQTKSKSTAEIYSNTLRLIKSFHPDVITFNQVNVSFLKKFELWMIDNGRSINYTRIQLRNIRAVFNSAIDDNLVELNLYPFRKYKIKGEKSIKRNLNIDVIRQIRDVSLTGVPEVARDVFMLIFYLIGINLKDLSHLKHSNLVDGRINYKRMKGKKDYSIKLEPEAEQIINKYKGEKYLINLLEHYSNYDNCKREINKKLKVVANTVEINEKLSTYYARHSWATIARNIGIRKDDIKSCLGHGDNTVTDIYIDLDEEVKDRANRKVLDQLNL